MPPQRDANSEESHENVPVDNADIQPTEQSSTQQAAPRSEGHLEHHVSSQTLEATVAASYEAWSFSLGDAANTAWHALTRHPLQVLLHVVGLFGVYVVLTALLQMVVGLLMLGMGATGTALLTLASMAGGFLIGAWFSLALYRWILEVLEGNEPRFGAFFELSRFGQMAAVVGLNMLSVLGAIVFFIVPGMALALRHFFALFAVFHTDSVQGAFTTSAHMSHGNLLRLFLYLLVFILVTFGVYIGVGVALIVFFMGALFAGQLAALMVIPLVLIGALAIGFFYLYMFTVLAALYRQGLTRPRPTPVLAQRHEGRTSVLLWAFGAFGAVLFAGGIAIGIYTGELAQDDSVFSNLQEAQENAERAQEMSEEAEREVERSLREMEGELTPDEQAQVEALFEQMMREVEEAETQASVQGTQSDLRGPAIALYRGLEALVLDLHNLSQQAGALYLQQR